jgi:ActR/RegA family two-component response regulator
MRLGQTPPADAALEEHWYVRRVVDDGGRNIARAARTLGVDRNTVRRRLRG